MLLTALSVVCIGFVSVLNAQTAPVGIAASYAFNEGSGVVVTDASGNSNTGAVSGATWTTSGRYGNALSFNGSSNRVDINDASLLDLTTGMTLEAWVFPTSSTGWRTAIMKERSGGMTYALYANNNASRPAVYVRIGGRDRSVTGSASLTLNTWNHLAATYDGTTLILYVNGNRVGSLTVRGSITVTSQALRIGGSTALSSRYFSGRIDEVLIYNRALSQAEIQTDMNTPITASPSDTTPPTAPGNLTATASGGSQINLSWSASTDAVGVTGYKIERCQGAGCSSFTQIATTTATSYPNTGLQESTSYSYRVRATDAASNLSGYSNIAGATTQTAGVEPAGWYAGDPHVHRSCGGSPEAVSSLYQKMSSQNLAVISLLADMGNGEVQDPVTDLPRVNGQDDPISTTGRIIHWDAEWHWDAIYNQYPHQALGGHIVALGLTEAHQIWEEYTYPILNWAHQQNGIAGFVHMQYLDDGIPQSLTCCTPIEYPVEVALGAADFISEDVNGGESAINAYYRLLNTGFRPSFTAGTDYPCGVSELGSLLTYVQVTGGQMTYSNWIDGIAKGRTVVSRNGHNEFLDLTVNNSAKPGDEINLTGGGSVPVTVTWTANQNLTGTIELVQNGVVVASKQASVSSGTPATLSATVDFTNSGWLAARRMDGNEHQVHTGAVFVTVNSAPVRASVEDAQFYVDWMDNLIEKTSPGGEWDSYFTTSLSQAQARYQAAKAIYQQIALEAAGQATLLNITTISLPGGTQYAAYSAALAASGGLTPYTWSISGGSLPAGLMLNTSTGVIYGTPTAAGTFNFTARVADSGNPSQIATRDLSITVAADANFTIWTATTVPGLVDGGPDGSVELGVKFRTDSNGYIKGIRFYKASTNTGTHSGNLWTSTGTLLATATFSGETSSGWQQVLFSNPVAITANTVYVASYHANNGHYSADVNYFATTGVDNPPLHALANGVSGGDGVYAYGATSSFPNQTWNSANYWVDVLFSATPPATLSSISVTPAGQIIQSGSTQQFTATGTYSDGSTQNITSRAAWASSNSGVATVNSAGLATAISPGSATISATLDSVTGGANLTVQPVPLAITTTSLPGGTQYVAYSGTVSASGGLTPYTWSISGGSLPTGLLLNSSTGAISGTPAAAGTFNFTLQVADAAAATATKALSLVVAAAPALTITTTSLPSGTLNVPYTVTLAAGGGLTPYTWQISIGSLPAGLSLNSSTGAVSGTPTAAGTFNFTARVADSGNPSQIATRDLSITVSAAVAAQTPILIISTGSNPFSSYYTEILRAEGFNEFDAKDVSTISSPVLASYDVVILGEMPLTSTQVSMFTDWVNAGGHLIAMRPDKKLAGLLGLSDQSSTSSDRYLLVNTSSGPGAGIVNETIQYHGTADLYSLNGASSLAILYSDATTMTSRPAVTLKAVGGNGGQAAAFTYDLARSVVYTRQGNPAWAGQERDGYYPIRSDDLFYPGWIDLNKVAIPQADEQQRLLANLMISMNASKKPLPRFWYLPRSLEAAVVMTGDDHGNNGTAGRFDDYMAMSPSGCSVANWECIRGTSYIYPDTPLSRTAAAAYSNAGFEISAHISSNCQDWTPSSLEAFFDDDLSSWSAVYSAIPKPTTSRLHCIVWSDYSSMPVVELNHGIRLDVNYYYWPPEWINNRPGMFTGSGMPMRFTDSDGNLIDVYQATTQMTDESGQSYPYTINSLLDKAIGPEGYYGVFTANMHNDTAESSGAEAIVNSALTRGIPVVSARQMLQWLDGRNASRFSSLSWSGNTLSFTISAGSGANGLVAMVPMINGLTINRITYNGSDISITVDTIKGIQYAFFWAASGDYQVTYALDTVPPTVSGVSPADGASGISTATSITASFSEAMDPSTIGSGTFELRTAADTLVPAVVSYDAATKTATLDPTVTLANSATYTVTLKGGTNGVKDVADNPLNSDVSWFFTTAAMAGPYTLWPETTVPGLEDAGPDNAVELGVRFTSDSDGYITGIRFYKASTNTGTHVANLWTNSGTKLATATFTNETSSGWQQVNFSSPVAITANTVYVASYHTNVGHYSDEQYYFSGRGIDSQPLHALADGVSGFNGTYAYGSASLFPNQGWHSSNYWVDVVFQP